MPVVVLGRDLFMKESLIDVLKQVKKALLNGLRTHHILIPHYHGTLFTVSVIFIMIFFALENRNLCSHTWKILCIFTGNGWIQQEIVKPSDYYIAVGNLNAQVVEVIIIIIIIII